MFINIIDQPDALSMCEQEAIWGSDAPLHIFVARAIEFQIRAGRSRISNAANLGLFRVMSLVKWPSALSTGP